MKKNILIIMVMIFASATVFGSIDSECQDAGFDYGIAKYACSSTIPEEGSGLNMTVVWGFDSEHECESVNWTSDFLIAGVISKEGNLRYVSYGGYLGTVYKTEKNAISHITFCGEKHPGNEVPEFSTIGVSLVLAGGAYLFLKKRN